MLEPLRLSGEELQSTDIVKILDIKISKDLNGMCIFLISSNVSVAVYSC